MKMLSAFLIGLLFGLGLVVSGLSNPAKILGFLNIAGDWDPSLAMVMGAAVATTFIGYRLVFARPQPLLEKSYQTPANTEIDPPLVIGAGIFGIGMGAAGLCPGPVLASLAVGGAPAISFLIAMALGILLRDCTKS